uniref:FBA_2 domain-containing protein n=1 Tax=Caenorhabditis tropicalis TaxID=1561998 RepID=A0A1I7TB27_9PELO
MIRNDFPYIPLGKAGGIDGWSLTMRRRFVHGEPVFRPMIHTFLTKPILKCRFYIRIWKNNELAKDPKENYIVLEAGNGPMTDKLIISEWMDEDYWTNGGILVDYGLQIEGFLSSDNIWTFNFHDKMFDCQEKRI